MRKITRLSSLLAMLLFATPAAWSSLEPPPPIDCGMPGIVGRVLGTDGNTLPLEAWPYLNLWKYADPNPWDDIREWVLVYVNGTNWYQECGQGQVSPDDGGFGFNVDWDGNPIPADVPLVLVVYGNPTYGFYTVYKEGIVFDGEKDTDLGKIVVGQSVISISDIHIDFVKGGLIVSYKLSNNGKGVQKLFPSVLVTLPGDMSYTTLQAEALVKNSWGVVTVKGSSSIYVRHLFPLRKQIPGFSFWGDILISKPGDQQATQVRSGFFGYTK